MAAGFALFRIQADVCRVFALQTELTANLIQPFDLLFGEFLRAAELFGKEQQLRIELDRFHLVIGIQKRIGIGERAVVRQENGVKILEVFRNGVRNFVRGRRAVFGDGNAAESDDRFRHNRLGERNSRNRKGSSVHRVRVHDRVDVRPLLIDTHVHLDLRRRLKSLVRLQNIAVFVNFADEFRSHETLADARRGAEKLMLVQFDRDVAVVRRNHAAVVNTFADVANLFFNLVLVNHFDTPIFASLFFCFIIIHKTTKVNTLIKYFLENLTVFVVFVVFVWFYPTEARR